MRKGLAWLCAAWVLWGGWAAASPAPGGPVRVFVVNSYNPEYFWSARQLQGIRDALDGIDAVYQEFFLDTKRHPETGWLERKAEECLAAIERFGPDIVFTGDDNATKTIARRLSGTPVPVVFYGVNAEPESYGLVPSGRRHRPGGNVTGVLERHYYVDAARLLHTVCGANGYRLERVYLLTDDTYTSAKLFESLRGVDWGVPQEVVFLPRVDTVAAYREAIRSINRPGNAVVLYNLMGIRAQDGTVLHDQDLMHWTRHELRIPSVAFHELYIRDGALLGILVSGYSQAYHAGLKGRRILEGVPPGTIPIDAADKGTVALNTTTLKRLGLKVPLSVLLGAKAYR